MTPKTVFVPVLNNTGEGILKVPGYGLPINAWPGRRQDGEDLANYDIEGYYRYGASDFVPERMPVREVAILWAINTITEKPNWEEKVFNDEIIAKWRIETQAHPDMTEAAFDWAIKELQDKVQFSKANNFITVLDNASCCVKSDGLVSKDVQDEVKSVLQPLMELPEPDWHPGSDEKVRNLVHPSLFPLVYGRSQVLSQGTVGLENCVESVGTGELLQLPAEPLADLWYWQERDRPLWSTNFQWLPCEVKFEGSEGTATKITSYINNLHPNKHQPIYAVIETLISASIKPWNEILIKGFDGRNPLRMKTFGVEIRDIEHPEWFSVFGRKGEEITEEIRQKVRDFMALPDGPHYDGVGMDEDEDIPDRWDRLSSNDLWDALCEKAWRRRDWTLPEPGQGNTYEEWKAGIVKPIVQSHYKAKDIKHERYTINLEKEYRDRGLQVIVKIASIELTPDKPTYNGGNWHLEGMINDHIVATSIYYYDVDNITDAKIRFRQEASLPEEDLVYEQGHHVPLEQVFGAEMYEGIAVQEIGDLSTPDGRFIAFPNTLQHCVQPFELVDKTKPGHRRFIVLWLVDPHLRVMSTANVPPQQHEWWAEEARKKSEMPVPPEVMEMIMSNTQDWPMGLEEAKKLRLELMEERTGFGNAVEDNFETYFLCEH